MCRGISPRETSGRGWLDLSVTRGRRTCYMEREGGGDCVRPTANNGSRLYNSLVQKSFLFGLIVRGVGWVKSGVNPNIDPQKG